MALPQQSDIVRQRVIAWFGEQATPLLVAPRQVSGYDAAVRLRLNTARRAPAPPEFFDRVEMNLEQVGNFDWCQFTGLTSMHNPVPQIQRQGLRHFERFPLSYYPNPVQATEICNSCKTRALPFSEVLTK